MDINCYQNILDTFAKERNWDQFHSPKNLSMALAGETGELLDIFQWLTEEDSEKEKLDGKSIQLIKEELADIMIYLMRIAHRLKIDLEEVVKAKIELNEIKYPVDISKNSAKKYNRR